MKCISWPRINTMATWLLRSLGKDNSGIEAARAKVALKYSLAWLSHLSVSQLAVFPGPSYSHWTLFSQGIIKPHVISQRILMFIGSKCLYQVEGSAKYPRHWFTLKSGNKKKERYRERMPEVFIRKLHEDWWESHQTQTSIYEAKPWDYHNWRQRENVWSWNQSQPDITTLD